MGHSSALLAAGACLVLALLPHTSAQPPTFGSSYTGDGTYYGIQPYPGSDQGSGHCSMQFANSYPLSWTTGVQNGVAMNHAQYAGACGLCVAFRGTGKGLGTAPIPLDWQYAIVTDECPECKPGDLDLAAVGDGRWIIEWHPVLCNVGNGVFQYSFQGSNAYYIKLQITNSRVPITKVQMQGALGLQDMAPTVDNYWLADGGPFTFPAQVIVTSMLDDTVNDIITTGPADTSTGAAQFPATAGLEVVGGQSVPAAPALPAETPAPTLPAETPAPTLPAETPAAETPAPTLPAETPAPTLPAETPVPETPAPTLPDETPVPTLPAETPAPTLPAETPAPETPAPETPAPTLPAETPAPETPAPPLPAETPAPETPAPTLPAETPAPTLPADLPAPTLPAETPAPTLPADTPAPTLPVSRAQPTVVATPAATSRSTDQSEAAEFPSRTTPITAPCSQAFNENDQCGGRGGICMDIGDGTQCQDAFWADTCCVAGNYCRRIQQWMWQCNSVALQGDVGTVPVPTDGSPIQNFHQCGGYGNCPPDLCADAPWSGLRCNAGFTCLRWDKHYWQCRDGPYIPQLKNRRRRAMRKLQSQTL